MIGVAQDNLSLHLLAEFSKVNALDRPYRTHWHENRGFDLTVVCCYQTGTGIAGCVGMLYFELHFFNFQFSILQSFFSSSSGISNGMGVFTIS